MISGYTPNVAANVVGCVLFGVVLAVELNVGIYAQDWWMLITWSVAAAFEFAGFLGRALASKYSDSMALYKTQLVCLTLAPVFIASGLYAQLPKLLSIYGRRYAHFEPMTYNAFFSMSDVITLCIQVAGGAVAAQNPKFRAGSWILVGGLSLQVVTLLVFMILFAEVNWRIWMDDPTNWSLKFAANRQRPLFKFWIPSVSLSVICIFIRSVYKTIEHSEGWSGHLFMTERYILVLDGLMMLVAMVPLCIVNPGRTEEYYPFQFLTRGRTSSLARRQSLKYASEEEAFFEPTETKQEE